MFVAGLFCGLYTYFAAFGLMFDLCASFVWLIAVMWCFVDGTLLYFG